jgi:hypothetical protein
MPTAKTAGKPTSTTGAATAEHDPRHHTANIKRMLNDVRDHVRQDVGQVDDPKAEALFEVTAEILQGLITAYDHFESRSEPAWK